MSAWKRLRNFFHPRPVEDDVRDELEALRAMAEPGELGNLTRAAENAREEWSWPLLERITRDLSMAFRTLRNSPGYSFACIAILAIGIGANTAMFSVVQAVTLKALPYPNADRLVFVWEKLASMPWPIGPRMQVPRIVYQEWQKQGELFEDIGAFNVETRNEAGVAKPRTLSTGFASASLLPLLGARATVGRLFRADEEQKNSDRVVVLSDSYFEQRFHRDPGAIGQSLKLGRDNYTVIGVLPPRFRVPAIFEGMDQKKPDIWIPLSRLWNRAADDTALSLYVLAHRRASVPLDQLRVSISALQERLNKSDKERFVFTQSSVFPAAVEDQSPYINLALYILLGAVGLLLLIGCANLANLTTARAAKRAREISIRRALGATRARVIGQLLTESLLLSIAGTVVGVLLAQAIIQGLLRSHAPISRPEEIELNWLVFAFAAAVSLLTTLLFGLAPAITVSKVGVNEALKSRGGGGVSASMNRGRNLLTTAEVGLAVVLLCGSGLLIRTFVNLLQTGLGFRTEKLLVADINLPEVRYPDAASRNRFYDTLLPRVRAIPGVSLATVSTTLPLRAVNFTSFTIAGVPKPANVNELPTADTAEVGSNYFSLMGLPVLQGRDFNPADSTRSRGKGDGTVLINRAFAETFFKGQNPLGQRLQLENDRPFEIVGVVENFLAMGALDDARPQFFRARTEASSSLLLLRTAVEPESLSDEVRSAVLSLDPELPVAKVKSMDGTIREETSDPQFVVALMSAFAALALLLAMLGVHSVLSNLVASQTRELGIRMALGATAGIVARMVVWQSLKPLMVGLVLGLAGSVVLSRVLEPLTEGVVPADPFTFALVAAAVLLVAPLAVWGPVRRATSVECTVALREE
jgi:putative ABC transport system permease protein